MQDIFKSIIIIMILKCEMNFLIIKSHGINVEESSDNSARLVEHISVVTLFSGLLNLLDQLLKRKSFRDSVHEETRHKVGPGFEFSEMFNHLCESSASDGIADLNEGLHFTK